MTLLAEMTFQGSFSYKNENPFVKKLDNGLILKIESHDEDFAKLYFINTEGTQIEIPDNIRLINITNGNRHCNPFMGVFLITWFSSYDLMKNQNILIKISNQKQQAIQMIDKEKMASPKQGENDTKLAEVEKSTAKITI